MGNLKIKQLCFNVSFRGGIRIILKKRRKTYAKKKKHFKYLKRIKKQKAKNSKIMEKIKRISLSGYEHLVSEKFRQDEEKYKASFVYLKKGEIQQYTNYLPKVRKHLKRGEGLIQRKEPEPEIESKKVVVRKKPKPYVPPIRIVKERKRRPPPLILKPEL